jgi:hypothetical protein
MLHGNDKRRREDLRGKSPPNVTHAHHEISALWPVNLPLSYYSEEINTRSAGRQRDKNPKLIIDGVDYGGQAGGKYPYRSHLDGFNALITTSEAH